jgi:hypothetical protein
MKSENTDCKRKHGAVGRKDAFCIFGGRACHVKEEGHMRRRGYHELLLRIRGLGCRNAKEVGDGASNQQADILVLALHVSLRYEGRGQIS